MNNQSIDQKFQGTTKLSTPKSTHKTKKALETLEYWTGSIFESNVQALVNPVNCQGIMGKGLALEFKRKYPENFRAYRTACSWGTVKIGRVFIAGASPLIINFPTKYYWNGKSQLEWIQSGLQSLVAEVKARDIESIAVPALGCGLGGLKWSDVRPLIEEASRNIPNVRLIVFPPQGLETVEQNLWPVRRKLNEKSA